MSTRAPTCGPWGHRCALDQSQSRRRRELLLPLAPEEDKMTEWAAATPLLKAGLCGGPGPALRPGFAASRGKGEALLPGFLGEARAGCASVHREQPGRAGGLRRNAGSYTRSFIRQHGQEKPCRCSNSYSERGQGTGQRKAGYWRGVLPALLVGRHIQHSAGC